MRKRPAGLEPGWLGLHLERNARQWKVLNAAMNGSEELIDELAAVIDRAVEREGGGGE